MERESFSTEPAAYRRCVDQAQAALEREGPGSQTGAELFARAAGTVPPGFERAFALGQLATIALKSDRPEEAVSVLLSEADWPHHVPAAYATLARAAVQSETVEAFRWLATRSGKYWEPSGDVLDQGVRIALNAKRLEFADELVRLAEELYESVDPIVPLLRGLVREKQKRPQDALAAYREAADRGGTDARIFRRLSLLLDKSKESEEAAEWCRRGLELNPDARVRQELEKRLARIEAQSGKPPETAEILPVYLRSGDASIERELSFPVQVSEATQARGTVWARATRRGSSVVFVGRRDEPSAELALDFKATRLVASPTGGSCLVFGHESEGNPLGSVVSPDGVASTFPLPGTPREIACLDDGWIASFREGALERRDWAGRLTWQAHLLHADAYAHFLAADEQIALASHLDRVYQFDPSTGEATGTVEVEPAKTQEISAGPITMGITVGPSWLQGLGVAKGRGFAIAGDQFYEVLPGPQLELRERLQRFDDVRVPMVDEQGQLLAFQGNDGFRLLGPNGELRSTVACPWQRHGLARLPDGRLVSYGGRELAVLDESGLETHRFETTHDVRSVAAVGRTLVRVVVARDVLSLQVDGTPTLLAER